jgi:capsular polysaccharide biosynthesis protein
MELVDILASVRRHWRIAIGMVVLAVGILAAFLVTRNEIRPPDRYQSGVQVLIPARDDKGAAPEGVPPELLQGQPQLANAQKAEVLDGAGLSGEQRRQIRLDVAQNERGDTMTLRATAPTPEQATTLAEAFSRTYVNARLEQVSVRSERAQQNARRQLERLRERLAAVEMELRAQGVPLPEVVPVEDGGTGTTEELAGSTPQLDLPPGLSEDAVLLAYERNTLLNRIARTQRTYAEQGVVALTPRSFSEIVERTGPNQVTPEPPSPLIPAAAILGVGALLSIAVPVLIDRMDHSIRDARSAAAAFAAPVLSAIPAPARNDRYALAAPGSTRDSAFRSLAATSVATNRLPRAIMVTSPTGHVQDTVAANFAASLANLGLRVALVATAPRQAWYASSSTENGDWVLTLPDLLELAHAGRLNGEVRHGLLKTPLPNLVVVPPGASDDLELSLDGLPPLLAALRSGDVDVTVIAGQPMLEDPNATIFAWATRSVLWVVESGEVTEAEAKEAAARMELAGVSTFGVTMVGASS